MTWVRIRMRLRFPADPSLYEYAEKLEWSGCATGSARECPVANRLTSGMPPIPARDLPHREIWELDLVVIATHARQSRLSPVVGSTTMSVLKAPRRPCWHPLRHAQA